MEIYLLVNFVLGFFLMHLAAFLNRLVSPFSKILGPVIVEEILKASPPIYLFYKHKEKWTGFLLIFLPLALGLGFGWAEAMNYFIRLIGYKGYEQLVLKRIWIITVHLIGSLCLGISLYFSQRSKRPIWLIGFLVSFLFHYGYNLIS